jgi:hypothetical protein
MQNDHVLKTTSMLGSIILDRIDPINDLRVIMDSRMCFTGHIEVTVGRAAWVCESVVV